MLVIHVFHDFHSTKLTRRDGRDWNGIGRDGNGVRRNRRVGKFKKNSGKERVERIY